MEINEVKDGNPEQVESIFADIFSSAQKNVRMSAGLWTDFYSRQGVRNAITAAAHRVDWFKLLLDNYVDVPTAREKLPWLFDLQREGKITIMQSENKIPHWIIVDENNFRLEKEHPPTEAGMSNLVIRNADKEYIKEIVGLYDDLWDDAHPVEELTSISPSQ